jgi:hypothetical protein
MALALTTIDMLVLTAFFLGAFSLPDPPSSAPRSYKREREIMRERVR